MKNVKFAIASLLLLTISVTSLFAEEPPAPPELSDSKEYYWSTPYSAGNTIISGDISFESWGYYTDYQFGITPGFEVIIFKPNFGGYAPLDFGAKAQFRVGLPLSPYSDFTMGLSICGTIHFGFAGFDFEGSEYLDPLEIYAEFGVGINFIRPHYTSFYASFVSETGVKYHFSDNFALEIGYSSWDHYDGISIGANFRFGDKPIVIGWPAS